jgi:hypothetical protein
MLVHVGRVVMIVKNWIILGVAVSAILVYTVGIPPSFSAEYSKSAQYTRSENNCGNTETGDTRFLSSDYEELVDSATYCSNIQSQIQGDENTGALSSTQR